MFEQGFSDYAHGGEERERGLSSHALMPLCIILLFSFLSDVYASSSSPDIPDLTLTLVGGKIVVFTELGAGKLLPLLLRKQVPSYTPFR